MCQLLQSVRSLNIHSSFEYSASDGTTLTGTRTYAHLDQINIAVLPWESRSCIAVPVLNLVPQRTWEVPGTSKHTQVFASTYPVRYSVISEYRSTCTKFSTALYRSTCTKFSTAKNLIEILQSIRKYLLPAYSVSSLVRFHLWIQLYMYRSTCTTLKYNKFSTAKYLIEVLQSTRKYLLPAYRVYSYSPVLFHLRTVPRNMHTASS